MDRHQPVVTPCAWRASDLHDPAQWTAHLTTDDATEIGHALEAVQRKSLPLEAITRNNFPLPGLALRLREWRNEVLHGRGFILLRGLPVETRTEQQNRIVFAGLSSHIGRPVSQNSYGDLLGDIVDTGKRMGTGKVRGSLTNENLRFHTDRCDVVGLLCLQKAAQGGLSSICSSMAIFNRILGAHPEYLEPLFAGCYYANIEEGGDMSLWRVPIYSKRDGVLSCRYSRNTIASIVKMGLASLTPLEERALDYMDELAGNSEFRIDMDLQPGDIQFINNYTTLHGRTNYVDDPAANRRRHLFRIWINVSEGRRPLGHESFDEYMGVPKTLSRGSTARISVPLHRG